MHYPLHFLVWCALRSGLLLVLFTFSSVLSAQELQGPRERHIIDPVYPPEALKAVPEGGTITLFLEINAEGRVYDVTAFGPSLNCQDPNNLLFEQLRSSAIDAARQSLFAPANRDGVPVIGRLIKTYQIKPLQSPSQAKVNEVSEPLKPPVPGQIVGSVINGHAVLLPKPSYPSKARAFRITSSVSVKLLIDEEGNIVNAEPTSGHPLLFKAAAEAGCKAKFTPTLLSGYPVKVSGIVTYNFVP